MPKTSRDKQEAVLIAAVSGRALAQAARRAGFAPLVVDFFADQDMRTAARRWHRLEGPLAQGFHGPELLAALHDLAAKGPPPFGIVCGSGFEARTDLLAEIAGHWPLIGNDAATVARVSDPRTFFSKLDAHAIAHPDIRLDPPPVTEDWLRKVGGGAGGGHIGAIDGTATDDTNVYYQRWVSGRAISALFLGDGRRSLTLGFSEQWTAPAPGRPMRYGGAVQPATLQPSLAAQLTDIVARLVTAFALKGLCSADFLVRHETPLLVDVNPRPGASLEIFDTDDAKLFALHMAAAQGRLPDRPPAIGGAKAAAVVYAPQTLSVSGATTWPDWVADRPSDGEWIPAEDPVCTVLASEPTGAQARRRVDGRVSDMLERVQPAAERLMQ